MNKDLIKTFAKQSGFHFRDAGFAPIEHTVPHEYSEECFNRFAELIVKEVSSFVECQRNDIPCTGDEMADTIRFYYGIK